MKRKELTITAKRILRDSEQLKKDLGTLSCEERKEIGFLPNSINVAMDELEGIAYIVKSFLK